MMPHDVVRVQVRVEGPNDGPERIADPVTQVLTISGPEALRQPGHRRGDSESRGSKVGPGLANRHGMHIDDLGIPSHFPWIQFGLIINAIWMPFV